MLGNPIWQPWAGRGAAGVVARHDTTADPMVFKKLREDVDSIIARDPAAHSRVEVILTYPGFHAVVLHRLAHGAWNRGFRLLGSWVAYFARWLTGIEIHPGARIGRRLFIDHGTGVGIGGAAQGGGAVTLCQDVTP